MDMYTYVYNTGAAPAVSNWLGQEVGVVGCGFSIFFFVCVLCIIDI